MCPLYVPCIYVVLAFGYVLVATAHNAAAENDLRSLLGHDYIARCHYVHKIPCELRIVFGLGAIPL